MYSVDIPSTFFSPRTLGRSSRCHCIAFTPRHCSSKGAPSDTTTWEPEGLIMGLVSPVTGSRQRSMYLKPGGLICVQCWLHTGCKRSCFLFDVFRQNNNNEMISNSCKVRVCQKQHVYSRPSVQSLLAVNNTPLVTSSRCCRGKTWTD